MHSESVQYEHHITSLVANNRGIQSHWHKGIEIKERADGRFYIRQMSFESLQLAKQYINYLPKSQ